MRTGAEIIADVAETVTERRKGYGHPAENFRSIAIGWQEILKCEVTARQVALCMDWLKSCRLISQPDHEDSVLDKMGYAMCYADCGPTLGDDLIEALTEVLDDVTKPKADAADPAWLDAPLPAYMDFGTCDTCPTPVYCKTRLECATPLPGRIELSRDCP